MTLGLGLAEGELNGSPGCGARQRVNHECDARKISSLKASYCSAWSITFCDGIYRVTNPGLRSQSLAKPWAIVGLTFGKHLKRTFLPRLSRLVLCQFAEDVPLLADKCPLFSHIIYL